MKVFLCAVMLAIGFVGTARADHWGVCSQKEQESGCRTGWKNIRHCHPLIGCDPDTQKEYCYCDGRPSVNDSNDFGVLDFKTTPPIGMINPERFASGSAAYCKNAKCDQGEELFVRESAAASAEKGCVDEGFRDGVERVTEWSGFKTYDRPISIYQSAEFRCNGARECRGNFIACKQNGEWTCCYSTIK